MSGFWKGILSSKGLISLKRFVTLIVAGHFILSAFTTLFLVGYLIFYLPKGHVDSQLIDLLKDILHYDMTIILGGLGVIGVDNIGQAWVERSKISKSQTDNEQQKILD